MFLRKEGLCLKILLQLLMLLQEVEIDQWIGNLSPLFMVMIVILD